MTATASADALSDQVIDDVENVAAATNPCCSDYQSDFESDYGSIQSEIDIENFGNDNMQKLNSVKFKLAKETFRLIC